MAMEVLFNKDKVLQAKCKDFFAKEITEMLSQATHIIATKSGKISRPYREDLVLADGTDLNIFANYLAMHFQAKKMEPPTEMQLMLAYQLQFPDAPNQIVMAPRGIGKSTVNVAFIIWCGLIYPDIKILLLSANKELAAKFVYNVWATIKQLPFLAELVPDRRKGHRDSAAQFDFGTVTYADSTPSVCAKGIESTITGTRADIIFCDDIEVPKNCATQGLRNTLRKNFGEVNQVIYPLDKEEGCVERQITPQIIMLGTPHIENNLYYELAAKATKPFFMRVYPALVPESETPYRGHLHPIYVKAIAEALVGCSVDRRFSIAVLEDKRDGTIDAGEGRSGLIGFRLNYMLDPSMSDADRLPLKINNLVFMSVNDQMMPVLILHSNSPEHLIDTEKARLGPSDKAYGPMHTSKEFTGFDRKILVIDPAGGKDDTAFCVLYYWSGYIAVRDWGGYKGYSEPVLKKLAAKASLYGVDTVYCEKNWGDGMFTELLKPVLKSMHSCNVEEIRVKGKKEMRICDTLEPVTLRHKLIMDTSILEESSSEAVAIDNSALYQFSHITRDVGALAHDDKVDVLAIGVSVFTDMMSRDSALEAEQAARAEEQAHMERWAKKFKVWDKLQGFDDSTLGGKLLGELADQFVLLDNVDTVLGSKEGDKIKESSGRAKYFKDKWKKQANASKIA